MAKIYAIIFDLDGTLTRPILDFDAIRREIGIEKGPVWESILQMSPKTRKAAEEILLRHEMDAANNCVLQPNATPEELRRVRDYSLNCLHVVRYLS